MRRAFWFVALLGLVGCVLTAHAGDPAPKPHRPRLEDAMKRAVARARLVENMKLVRVSSVPSMIDDDEALIVVCEYGPGDVAVFQGGLDADSDQWILIDRRGLDLLIEASIRGRSAR